jgi:parallel beta-helix repeat protein
MNTNLKVVLIAFMLINGIIILVDTAPNVTSGSPPPPNDGINGLQYIDGNWIVSGLESYTNEIIVLSGNLTILASGALTFDNVTLMMNCTNYDGEYNIEVQGWGTFNIMNNSNITDSNFDIDDNDITDHEFGFWVRNPANFTMKDSTMRECGWGGGNQGLTIEASDTLIENSLFRNNYNGIRYNLASGNRVLNSTFLENEESGIYLEGSDNTYIFNINATSNNWAGIALFWAYDNIIENSTFVSNSLYGVRMEQSDQNRVINSSCINNQEGIRLWNGADRNVVDNCNTSYNSEDGIHIVATQHNTVLNSTGYFNQRDGIRIIGSLVGGKDDFNHTIPTNNLVNGKPVHYFFDKKDEVMENLDAGHIIYAYSENVTLINSSTAGGGLRFDFCSNSTVSNFSGIGLSVGAVTAYSSNITLHNINLKYNFITGFVSGESKNIKLVNSSILDNGLLADIALSSDSHVTLLNTTFFPDKIIIDDSASTLSVKWFLNVKVLDYSRMPIEAANVIVKNVTGDIIYSKSTGPDGHISGIVIEESWQNASTKIFYTPHNITAIKDLKSTTIITTMNMSKEVILLLEKYQQKLPYGWNFISVPVVSDNNSLVKVLESLDDNYNAVQHFPRESLEYVDNYTINTGVIKNFQNSQKGNENFASLNEELVGSTFTVPVPQNFTSEYPMYMLQGYFFASYVPIPFETDITRIDLFFGDDGSSVNPFRLAIYDDDGPSGAPGSLLSWTDTFRPKVQNDYGGAEIIGGQTHFLPGSYWFSFTYAGSFGDFNLTFDINVTNNPNADPVNNNGSYYKIFEYGYLPWPNFPSTFLFDDQLGISAGLFRARNGTYNIDLAFDIDNIPPAERHTLEISYQTNGEGLDVLVYNGSAWNDRGDLDSVLETSWNYNLTISEYNNGLVKVKLVGQNEIADINMNKMNLYYLRVSAKKNRVWEHYTTFKSFGTTLYDLDHTLGFWIFISNISGATFSPSGFIPPSAKIKLHFGWNQVGYPSSGMYNRSLGLNNLNFGTHVDAIQWYDTTSKAWYFMGPSDNFVPGRGYWVHSKVKANWVVPM